MSVLLLIKKDRGSIKQLGQRKVNLRGDELLRKPEEHRVGLVNLGI